MDHVLQSLCLEVAGVKKKQAKMNEGERHRKLSTCELW